MPKQLTYANVTATLALFIALGGSSYAAVKITGKQIADSSLTTKDIKNSSLLKRDFKAGQLPAGTLGPQGLKGEQGSQGLTGEKGNDGTAGAPGSAAAYAGVSEYGGLYDPPSSKNVDRVFRTSDGFYCVHTTVTPHHVVATLYGDVAGEISAYPNLSTGGIHCNGPDDGGFNIFVNTYDSAGTRANRAFSIAIN